MTLNQNVDTAVTDINEQIKGLTNLGERKMVIKTPGYRIAWSNGNQGWWMYYGQVKPAHGSIWIDANELFVHGHTKGTIQEALPDLMWHPLFWNSYEAQNTKEA